MRKLYTLLVLSLSFLQIQAQCYVNIISNKKTICANQSAILRAESNQVLILPDTTTTRTKIVNVADIKDLQSIKPMINSGLVTGLTLPFPNVYGSIDLGYSQIHLKNTMISSGRLEITILTDFIQDTKIVIEFPYILKNNTSLKDSILIDGTKLTVGQNNSITKEIDLTGTMIDFTAGDPTKYNTLTYAVKTSSKITTKILVGNETIDMDIKLAQIKCFQNTSFTWFKDNVKLEDKNSASIEVTIPGLYRVDATSICGSASDSISITKNPTVIASISTNDKTVICAGDTTKLLGQTDSIYSLQWLRNEKNIPGATSIDVFALTTGIYQLKVSDGICEALSNSINITVNPLPSLEITNINPFILINEDPFYLSATPNGGSFKGEGIKGSVFYPTSVSLGKKSISYTYTSPQGCSNTVTKNTIIVDSTGKVYTKYDTITTNITKYDTVIVNKTKYDTVIVKTNVFDTVKVTNYDTVSILKVKFKLTTGLQANQMASMSVYPNPTTDVLHIEVGDAKTLDGYRYRILDALGKEVYNELVKNALTEIPLKTLGAAGMYQLEVLDANKTSIQTNKIVLQ